MPGGTHFYEGDVGDGLAFSIAEVSLFAAGIIMNEKIGRDNKTELNIPMLLSGQLYTVDKWSYFQKSLLRLQHNYPGLPLQFDSTPLSELLLAPFNPKVIKSPLVIIFAVLGVIDGHVSYPKSNKLYSDISTIIAANNQMSRDTGTYYYEGMALSISCGAAISEEMAFRGLMLPIMDYTYGKRVGLITTSMTFGLLHLLNPDIDKPLYLVSQATLAGFVFGHHVQHNDYKLSQVIAAHFWYNFVSMTTTWITNPKENPLGIGVRFKFNL